MSHIFISYKRQDRRRAETLARALQDSGWDVWWDRELESGDFFDTEIEKQIKTAGCLIVLWSAESVESNYVKSEVLLAQDNKVRVLPVSIEDVDLPLGFQRLQTESLSGWAGDRNAPQFRKLAKAIDKHVPRGGGLPAPEKQHALLIVVDDYPLWPEARSLQTGQANARAIKKLLLSQPCGWDEVETLHNPECKDLEIALERLFRRADPRYQVLFYYFGHVAVASDGRLYLSASDTQPDVLDSTSVPLRSWLRDMTNSSGTNRSLILLDADYLCATPDQPKIEIARELHNQIGGSGRGKYVMAATTQLGGPVESEGEELSPFTRHFVEGIERGAAASDEDSTITAEEVYRYIAARMGEEGCRYLPEGWSFNLNLEDLVLARRRQGRTRPVSPRELDPFRIVRNHLVGGRVVPFIGSGIYGSGPLSPFLLSSALLREAGLSTEDKYEIATAAQYLQQQHDDRSLFLQQFREILDEQEHQAPESDIHSLILKLKPPLLVVSASYDFALERRLAGKRPHVLVSHVLSSKNGDEDGKLLVVRRGEKDEASFCLSDQLDIDEERDVVIYKILGSPYLHDFVDKSAEIDTVVVTETDHMKLLGRLEGSDKTSVPTAFSEALNQKFLVFVGYTLDLWHYRLIAHIFERYRTKKRYAVRQPVSPIEDSSWEALGVKLIQADPPTLAEILATRIQD